MTLVILSPSGRATGEKLAKALEMELHARTAPADEIFSEVAPTYVICSQMACQSCSLVQPGP